MAFISLLFDSLKRKENYLPPENVHHFDTEIPHSPLKLKPADIGVTTQQAMSPPRSSSLAARDPGETNCTRYNYTASNELLRARTLDGVE